MGKVFRIISGLFSDGWRVWGAVSWLASLAFTVCKIFGLVSILRQIDYAWALLPIALWLLVAYVRRFLNSEAAIADLKAKYDALQDEYPHSLRLLAIDVNEQRRIHPTDPTQIVERFIQITFKWKNFILRPIRYRTLKTVVNGTSLAIGHADEVISGNAETTFYCQAIPGTLPRHPNMMEAYQVSLEIEYGPANRAATRRVLKTMEITAYPDLGRNTFVYSVNTDEPIT